MVSVENKSFFCNDAEATRVAGRELAGKLRNGNVVALEGPLGAGKTEFVKGLAEGLGCTDVPTSPTFAIAHEYDGGRLPFFHFDFYRMERENEVRTSGFFEVLNEGIIAVEWASKFPQVLPAGTIHVQIAIVEEEKRIIEMRNENPEKQ